ncbi:MAG: hypothetical protein ACO1Q7_08110 [Gemmatimonas sp.]
MSNSMDAQAVRDLLSRAQARLGTIAVVEGVAAGLAVASLLLLLRWNSPRSVLVSLLIVAVCIAAGAGAFWYLRAERRKRAALEVERAAPQCHNLIISAHEILTAPGMVREGMAALVFRQASAAIRTLDVAVLFPITRAAQFAGAGAGALALVLVLQNTSLASQLKRSSAAVGALPSVDNLVVSVDAPAYAERKSQTLENPSRVEALADSRLSLRISGSATAVVVETVERKDTLRAGSNGEFSGSIVAATDGFVSIEPLMNGVAGTRRLVGLSVTQDGTPRVKLTAPGKDMIFPDVNRVLNVSTEAQDDIGLATLRLRYTKVSGSGEQFTFTEGEVPLQVVRDSAASWKGTVRWSLASLGLEPGDMVVYRAVATDKRPGSPVSESDSYIAEIRKAGSEAVEGFAVDPEEERYALSQQMIILKTERLLAKKATITQEAFAEEASAISVEQMRVRAEFVFMMGGELADNPEPDDDMTMLHEHEEAEAEGDILDGRGANRGRQALVRAIRTMSSAAQLLNVADAQPALVREKAALKDIEQAFSHTRIILRALSQAEKLDMSRRMTGPLLDAGRDVRALPVGEHSERLVALRRVLAGIAELASQSSPSALASASPVASSQQASELAERVLRVDPSAKPLQSIAAQLNEAAAALGKANATAARASLDKAAVALTETLRGDLVTAPASARSLSADRLNGALRDALRRGSRTGAPSGAPTPP